MTKGQKLSAVIHTKNSAETIERTLRSVQFADEIIVIDMQSEDDTVNLIRPFTKKVFSHKDVGYADPARNFGLSKVSSDWVLVVDDDEVVPDALSDVILSAVRTAEAEVYYLPRKNMVFGSWIRKTGWWPDYQPRLFRKGSVSWQKGVHRQPDVTGKTAYFPAEESFALLHYNYQDVDHFLRKLNSYTSLQAKERPRLSSGDFSARQLMEIFSGEFAKRALAQDGIEDGLHGVSLSLLQAMYESVIYLKQWGQAEFPQTSVRDFEKTLSAVQKTWRYWWADYQVRHTAGWQRLYWRIRRKLMR